jgi:hypothetical protein
LKNEDKLKKNLDKVIKSFLPAIPQKIHLLGFRGDGHKELGISEMEWPSSEIQNEWTHDERELQVVKALNWYTATQEDRSMRKLAYKSLSASGHALNLVKKLERSDRELSITACKLIRMMQVGYIPSFRNKKFIAKEIAKSLSYYHASISEKTSEDKPNIQDRLNEKVKRICAEIDGLFSDFIYGGYKGSHSITSLISSIPSNKKKDVIAFINDEMLPFKKAQAKIVPYDEDYRTYSAKQLKSVIEWFERAINEINAVAVQKRAIKVRKKKAVPPAKIVANLKYLHDSSELKITSINSIDILKSAELWAYNEKTRKIQHFVAIPNCTLDVKGTKILNLDESKSVQKTLRKPAEQLKKFMALGTSSKTLKWFSEIHSVDMKIKSCIGPQTLLLKTFK